MATKKKVLKKKATAVTTKRKTPGKRIVIGKNVTAKKKTVVSKKQKKTNLPLLTAGADLHLIPVTGEIHPARMDDKYQIEENYKHSEETALHLEQQKAKQIVAMTRNGGGKRIFKNRGQN